MQARRGPLQSRLHDSRSHGAGAGFTLIELMVVIVILALLTGTVAVSIEAMLPRSRLNSEVRALAATLQGARSDAIARNAEFFIEYDLDAEAYRVITPFSVQGGLLLYMSEEEDRMAFDWHTLADTVELASVYLAGDQISDGTVLVRFDPLGAASDHAVVLVQPNYENFYTIEVLALTGLIRFHEGVYTREAPEDADFN
jgi:prepilin-type N-terminal cleavage/methylation domain-containing protein